MKAIIFYGPQLSEEVISNCLRQNHCVKKRFGCKSFAVPKSLCLSHLVQGLLDYPSPYWDH